MRNQIRYWLLALAGVALIAVPLWLTVSSPIAWPTDPPQGGVVTEQSLAVSEEWRLSPPSMLSIGIGSLLAAFGMYCSVNYARQLERDIDCLKTSLQGEGTQGSSVSKELQNPLLRDLERAFESRMESFDDWIERLNNDRTEALAELERSRFSFLERLSENSDTTHSAVLLSARKGDFLATMSHEIRTPMNGVLAVADDLLSYDFGREIQEKIEMIKLSGESLVRILDDVLDFSKIEAGKLDVKLQSFDFIFACTATHSLFKARAKEKGLRYELVIAPDVPQFVLGDSVRVRQVVANLLSNALKFTDEGGVSLTIAMQDRDREGLLLSVVDSGMGIDPKSFERMFEAFSQAESGLEEKGTGLGLAISKRLASLMDGELTYERNMPSGSVFEFWIPYFAGSPVAEELDLSRTTEVVENARILIVEDNRINQHVIESLLERATHEVHVASNGLEALERVEEIDFDLIFMDCLMPKLNGFETAKRIRAFPADHMNRGTPIIALTANAFAHDRDLCFEAGMNDFLAKPVKKETLLGAVNYYCRAKQV
ncbi:response regulator [Pelagicoccus sp. SDUM812002]|uniref:response regulator n=1 Tax=Pelagicoccus sp. SDUM812002 TaxID=3041266 RepID=UPI00280FD11C|nr:response regulator [Pelagicoccus sp. SDUM812002]MDQ8185226.1 response regulator [Pelagicoccus sp. SDUM812002]